MRKRILLIIFLLLTPVLVLAEPIHWQSYKDGLSKGKSEHKKIFLNFHAEW